MRLGGIEHAVRPARVDDGPDTSGTQTGGTLCRRDLFTVVIALEAKHMIQVVAVAQVALFVCTVAERGQHKQGARALAGVQFGLADQLDQLGPCRLAGVDRLDVGRAREDAEINFIASD